jgi:undecaprenyl-diphosphatase
MTTVTTGSTRLQRPWTVLAGVAGLVVAFAVASWTVHMPSTLAVYRQATAAVTAAPSWLQRVLDTAAEAGVLALAALVSALVWRARSAGAAALARAVVAGGGVVVAYATSEVLKLVLAQPRPCATLGAVLGECPGPGDWSLPSNHATVAAALAAAVVLMAPRCAVPALAAALVVAASRVGTGVHYPHDVLTGLAVGAGVVAVCALVLDRPARAVVRAAAGRWPAIAPRP